MLAAISPMDEVLRTAKYQSAITLNARFMCSKCRADLMCQDSISRKINGVECCISIMYIGVGCY